MLFGELTDARITKPPTVRVTARNVVLEVKLNDSGVKVNGFISHPVMMYYFLQHGLVDTKHALKGR